VPPIDLMILHLREDIGASWMRHLKNEYSMTDSYECIRKNLYFIKYIICVMMKIWWRLLIYSHRILLCKSWMEIILLHHGQACGRSDIYKLMLRSYSSSKNDYLITVIVW